MLYVRDATRRRRFDRRRLERTAERLLDAVGEGESSLAVSLVGDAAIRRMNREHRGRDAATDVLSFRLHDGRTDPHGVERLLGDIVISVPTATRQAAAYDASVDAELTRLLIHGLLHLLGHDHERPSERARMRAEERRLAAAVGVAWPY